MFQSVREKSVTPELTHTIVTIHPEDTGRAGSLLGRYLQPGDIVPLIGCMGAGKTCFVNGVARGLGVPESVPVTSPSFTLINQYDGRIPVFHIDLYRLSGNDSLDDLELDDIFSGGGVLLMEWPQLALPRLPHVNLEIQIEWDMKDECTRSITFITPEDRFMRYFEELRKC